MPPTTISLEQLYSAHIAGDREASRELVERLTPLLADTARKLGAPRDERDDLVQETWLAVLADRARPGSDQPLVPWTKAVLRHRFLRATRRARLREERQMAREAVELDALELAAPDAERSHERRELEQIVRAALARLPSDYRAPLALHLFEGLTPLEVARRLALPRSSVRVLLHRGRERLARSLPRGAVTWALLLRLNFERFHPSRWRAPRLVGAFSALLVVAVLSWLSASSSPGANAGASAHGRQRDRAQAALEEQRAHAGANERTPVPASTERERDDELLVEVLDPDGRPLPGVGVWLEPLDGRDPRLSTRTAASDASGAARFSPRPLGPARVSTDHGDARIVAAGERSAQLRAATGRELRARVVDEHGNSIQGAALWLGDVAGSRRGTVVAHTDASGRFALAHVPPTARFAVLANGFARTAMLSLPAPGAEELTIALARGAARVSVLVRSSSGAPLADALVIVGPSVDGLPPQLSSGVLPDFPPPLQARTDASGRVEWAVLETGAHPLVVRARGFVAQASTLEVAAGEQALAHVTLEPATIVRGRVLDDAGQPLEGAQLAWSNENELHTTYVTSTRDGEFAFECATAGNSTLAARALNHGAVERTLTLASGAAQDLELALAPLPRCTGRLLDSSGAPLAGHSLRLMGAPAVGFAPNSDEALTSAEGDFSLAVPGGEIRAIEFRAAHSPQWLNVRRAWLRERDGTLDIVVPLEAWPTCALRGRVLSSDAQPLAQRSLALVERSGARAGFVMPAAARTDERGEFELGPLSEGEYQLVLVRTELDAPDAPVGSLGVVGVSAASSARVEFIAPAPIELAWELRLPDERLARAPVLALALPDAALDLALAHGARGSLRVVGGSYTLRAMGEDFAPVAPARVELAEARRLEWSPALEPAQAVQLLIDEFPDDVDELAGLRVLRASDSRELSHFELAPPARLRPTFTAFLPPGDYSAQVRRRDGSSLVASFTSRGADVIELRWNR